MPALYEAIQHENGTFDILGVPIFGFIPKGTKGAPFDIDGAWMRRAIRTANFRESEMGYLPPLNIHHRGIDKPMRAGHFRVQRVEEMTYDGKKIPVVFADLVRIPQHIFRMMMDGELPYRSVEVFDFSAEKPVINHLALLDTEEPFFRFPMLNAETIEVADSPVLAGFGSEGGAGAALFCFREKTMPKIQFPESTRSLFEKACEDNTTLLVKASGETFSWGQNPVEFVSVEPAKLDGMPEDEKGLKALIAKATAALKKLQGGDSSDKKPSAAPAEPAKASATESEEIARLTARLDKQEAEFAAMKGDAANKGRVEAAVAKLSAANVHVSAKVRGNLERFAKSGDEKILDAYVETLVERPDPAKDLDDLPGASEKDPDEVAAFATDPKRLKHAREVAKDYEILSARGGVGDMSLEDFLAIEMETFAA